MGHPARKTRTLSPSEIQTIVKAVRSLAERSGLRELECLALLEETGGELSPEDRGRVLAYLEPTDEVIH